MSMRPTRSRTAFVLGADRVERGAAIERRRLHGLVAGGREPVRPLPPELVSVHRVGGLQPRMQRAAARVAADAGLRVGPCHVVIAAVAFHRALVHEALDRVRRAEAAHVERPQIHAWIAIDDPVGHHPARAAGGRDAGGKPAAQVEIVELGGEPDDRLAVGGDRDRAVDQLADPDLVQHRNAHRRGLRERLETVEVRLQEFRTEVGTNAVVPPRRRVRFPSADRERARLRLDVEIVIGIAQRRQSGRNLRRLLGDVVLVLDGAGSDPRADHGRDVAAPHAGRIDDAFGFDVALVGDHARDSPSVLFQCGDVHVLHDTHTAGARARGVSGGEARRIDVTVAGDPRRADDTGRVEQRKALARLVGRDEVDVEAEAFRHRCRALQFAHARGRGGEADAAHTMPAGRLSRLRFEPRVELRRIAHEACEVAAAAQLADQARGVPGRAVGERKALEEDDVALAALGEVIGDAAADGAAADDDDAGGGGNGHPAIVDCRQFADKRAAIYEVPTARRCADPLGRTATTIPGKPGRVSAGSRVLRGSRPK
jgi:hypothetical protein